MGKRTGLVIAVIFTSGLQLWGQQAARVLGDSALRFPSLTIADNTSFSLASAFNRMEMRTPDFLPMSNLASSGARSTSTTSAALSTDPSKEVVTVQKPTFDYAGGEIGAIYGRSSGKFGGDFAAGYIIGEVGNEHLQISAGASYEHSSRRR